MYRILSSTGAPYEARARPLLSALPLENVLTTSVLLFLRRSARLLSRARAGSVLPLSTMFSAHSVFHDPFLSSLAFTSEPVFPPAISLPYVFRSYLNGARPVSLSQFRISFEISYLFLFPSSSLLPSSASSSSFSLFSFPAPISLSTTDTVRRFIFFELEYFRSLSSFFSKDSCSLQPISRNALFAPTRI